MQRLDAKKQIAAGKGWGEMIEGGGSSSLDVARAAAGAHGFAVGDPGVVVASLKTLLNGPFKDHDVKVATVDAQRAPRIEMVRELAARAEPGAAR